MAKYGMPYQGSKGDLAERVLSVLPAAENFYDLFGGGFSVTDCAVRMFRHKYKSFYFNEIQSGNIDLIQRAIKGEFNYSRFKPKWISREEFFESKDPYVKILWSFGNNMKSYLFGKDVEPIKKSAHNAVVFNEFDQQAKDLLGIEKFYFDNIKDRRLALKKIIAKRRGERFDLEQLQQLERLKQLERLEQLERLLTFTSLSYEQVHIKPNSVIYCDPPYIGTAKYQSGDFDHKRFYEWVYSNQNPVFFSEYTAPRQFKLAYLFTHIAKFSSAGQSKITEKLYCNDAGYKLIKSKA
jgi:site-specific DNA-adenine methylase